MAVQAAYGAKQSTLKGGMRHLSWLMHIRSGSRLAPGTGQFMIYSPSTRPLVVLLNGSAAAHQISLQWTR